MPCKAMDTNLNVPFSAAVSCIEWCKNNFENIATMGGRQRTGIYVTAWGANSVADSESLRAVIQRVGETANCRPPLVHLWSAEGARNTMTRQNYT